MLEYKDKLCLRLNINWRDVQRKHVVNNVDMPSLRAPWQNGPKTAFVLSCKTQLDFAFFIKQATNVVTKRIEWNCMYSFLKVLFLVKLCKHNPTDLESIKNRYKMFTLKINKSVKCVD